MLGPEEARRRVSEILLVATDAEQRLAGVCTAYLQYNQQLRAEMWYFRAFVASAHRQFNLAVTLALEGRDHLVNRYVSGEDRRGLGIIFEVENRGLQTSVPRGSMDADELPVHRRERARRPRARSLLPGRARARAAPEPQGSA